MPYLKDLTKKVTKKPAFLPQIQKMINVLGKAMRIGGYVSLAVLPLFLVEMYVLKQFPYSFIILFLASTICFACFCVRQVLLANLRYIECQHQKAELIAHSGDFTLKMYNDWVTVSLIVGVLLAVTAYYIYRGAAFEYFSGDWWKYNGYACLSLLGAVISFFLFRTDNQPYYRLQCRAQWLSVSRKKENVLQLKTDELKYVFFRASSYKNRVQFYQMSLYNLQGAKLITLHIKPKDFLVIKKYLEAQNVPLQGCEPQWY
jgi:hypothetical protein